jgi:hypothetical protein
VVGAGRASLPRSFGSLANPLRRCKCFSVIELRPRFGDYLCEPVYKGIRQSLGSPNGWYPTRRAGGWADIPPGCTPLVGPEATAYVIDPTAHAVAWPRPSWASITTAP